MPLTKCNYMAVTVPATLGSGDHGGNSQTLPRSVATDGIIKNECNISTSFMTSNNCHNYREF